MFEAKAIKFAEVAAGPELTEATADGRGFAVSGGVANAVEATSTRWIRTARSR